ncbi:FAD-binding oxidoreductase [Nocardiopsis alba]|uniref:FAD linked oxidase, C-terminal domain protein n=1 Tax=Nocardiopsis alba (strain ATCC BAA-2165 / BE74) TaxID=1205910 RepID=J7LH72_NOCAA|nr:FAD-binding oxidoreductase [Nocardiopsis alba]AFR09967.1 FAD linked oxidase, C-terminal domain protein [Nocardiopsis alba ATCC BAA-2165]
MDEPDVKDVALREGTDEDAMCGVVPARVARPENVGALAGLLAAAREAGLTVAARGGGTAMDWGTAPRSLDLLVDTSGLSWIDHNAGDLVVEVGAGTPVADLERVLAEAGQRLSYDPVRSGGTVGGALATGLSGPGRLLAGALRDLVIGMTVVRADGVVARSGGRVVKNVAGYDLAKLHTGGYGTLGIIVSATFRLHPRPPAVRLVSAPAPSPEAVERAAAALRASTVAPSAVESIHPLAGPPRLYVLLEGTEEGTTERADVTARALGGTGVEVAEATPPGWGLVPDEGCLIRVLAPPAELPGLVNDLVAAADRLGVRVGATASLPAGTLYLYTAPGASAEAVSSLLERARSDSGRSATLLRAEPHVRDADVDVWGEVPGLALMRAIKDSLDPDHRLSPGRFAGGI